MIGGLDLIGFERDGQTAQPVGLLIGLHGMQHKMFNPSAIEMLHKMLEFRYSRNLIPGDSVWFDEVSGDIENRAQLLCNFLQ